jgi:hypothetical protein
VTGTATHGLTWVIVHPEWGVFAGHALGMAFFSLHDVGAQENAATFETRAQAEALVLSWRGDGMEFDPAAFSYHDVACDDPMSATPEEMAAAGIPERMIEPFRLAEAENRRIEREMASAMRRH